MHQKFLDVLTESSQLALNLQFCFFMEKHTNVLSPLKKQMCSKLQNGHHPSSCSHHLVHNFFRCMCPTRNEWFWHWLSSLFCYSHLWINWHFIPKRHVQECPNDINSFFRLMQTRWCFLGKVNCLVFDLLKRNCITTKFLEKCRADWFCLACCLTLSAFFVVEAQTKLSWTDCHIFMGWWLRATEQLLCWSFWLVSLHILDLIMLSSWKMGPTLVSPAPLAVHDSQTLWLRNWIQMNKIVCDLLASQHVAVQECHAFFAVFCMDSNPHFWHCDADCAHFFFVNQKKWTKGQNSNGTAVNNWKAVALVAHQSLVTWVTVFSNFSIVNFASKWRTNFRNLCIILLS